MKKLINFLLAVTFLKGLVWAGIVPLWHFPDEQAHFAEIQFIAEKKRLPIQIPFPQKEEKDLSKEILISERLLGTERDEAGNNKFTYHSEYNIPYENGFLGKFEDEIKNIPKAWRSEMVKNEAVNYPPLYYLLGAAVYRLFYPFDLFVRVFAVRILLLILTVGTVYFTFKIAQEVFPKKPFFQIIIPALVSFQPMFTFVGSGVSGDNLLNFLFTVFLYLGVKIINEGVKLKTAFWLGIVSGLGILTKPQFFVVLPLVLLLFFWKIKGINFKTLLKSFFIFIFSLLIFGGFWPLRLLFLTGSPLTVKVESFLNPYSSLSFWAYLKMIVVRIIRETLPWYWGVFKWLGVTLPPLVNRILMRVLALAIMGIFIQTIFLLKKKKFDKTAQNLLFLGLAIIVYSSAILFFDWQFIRMHGFGIGIQGRYFFPTISAQMTLFAWGLSVFLPSRWPNFQKFGFSLIALGIVALNFVALKTITSTYYPAPDFSTLVLWVSQYKPQFLKGNLLIFFSSFYLLVLGLWLKNFFRFVFSRKIS